MPKKTFILGIIDGKLHNNEFIIFELGNATASTFVGYNHLNEQPVEQIIAQTISEFAIQNNVNQILIEDDPHILSIINNEEFIHHINELGKNKYTALLTHFKNYSNINDTLLLPLNDEITFSLNDLLKGYNTIALNYDGSIDLCFSNKVFLDLFLSKVNAFYPKTKLIHSDLMINNRASIKEFLQDFHQEHLVIKPTNATLGIGVTVITKQQFEQFLIDANSFYNKSLQPDIFAERYFLGDKEIAKHWLNDKYMLIQEYVPGMHKNNYDATGRIIFKIEGELDNLNLSWQMIANYWKLPREPQTEQSVTAANAISHLSRAEQENISLNLNEDEQLQIQQSLYKYLLPLISRILTTTTTDIIKEFLEEGSLLHITYCMNKCTRYMSNHLKTELLKKLQRIYRTTENMLEQQLIISSVLHQMWYPFHEESLIFIKKIIGKKDPKINDFVHKMIKDSNLLNIKHILFDDNN